MAKLFHNFTRFASLDSFVGKNFKPLTQYDDKDTNPTLDVSWGLPPLDTWSSSFQDEGALVRMAGYLAQRMMEDGIDFYFRFRNVDTVRMDMLVATMHESVRARVVEALTSWGKQLR